MAAPEEDVFWTMHIEPLLKEHCVECHNTLKPRSGFDVSSLQTILRGGELGAAALPGRPEDSNLYKFLLKGSDTHMPPKGQLNEEQVGLVKTWITKLTATTLAATTDDASNHAEKAAKPAKPRWVPPVKMAAPEVIDHFVELGWKDRKVKPAKAADDAAYVRRVYLDIIGRPPTPAEADSFVKNRKRDKRTKLVDDLLASGEYPSHLREVFDVVLMGRRGANFENQRESNQWFKYLETAFQQNRPWNEVLREMIVARPERPEDRGAIWFLYERKNNAQATAEALAPVVLGTQIKCAQCHDHMIAREIKQAHYWSMVAAFNRSKTVDTPNGPAVGESAIGGFVSFANLKKESSRAYLTFLNGKKVDEDWPKGGDKEVDAPEKYLVPPPTDKKTNIAAVPKFSRRTALAEAMTQDNPLLARATVNRMWALFMGRGIVHPVDLMDSKHPPSHPELLDWLSEDFERSGYDLKRLIKSIVATKTYQLDSRPRDSKLPPPEAFAYALEKPLSAEQLYRALLISTGNRKDAEGKIAGQDEKKLRGAFVSQFPDLFAPEYNATLQQALFYSNSSILDQLVAPAGDNLAARLLKLATPRDRAKLAIETVYGRAADTKELAEATKYLSARAVEPGVKQLLWALVTSTEFSVNH